MFDPSSHPYRLVLDSLLLLDLVAHFESAIQGDSEIPFMPRPHQYGQIYPLGGKNDIGQLRYPPAFSLSII